MSIKSPQTYAEWYWKHGVDAEKEYAESIETELAPSFGRVLSDIIAVDKLDPAYKSFLQSFVEPTSHASGEVGLRFASEIADSLVSGALEPGVRVVKQGLEAKFLSQIITATEAMTLKRRKKLDDPLYSRYLSWWGYSEDELKRKYPAIEPFPTIPELITYCRYHGDPDNVWTTLLDWYEIETKEYPVWDWLGRQRLTTIQAQTLLKRDKMTPDDFDLEINRIGWDKDDRDRIKDLAYTLPNSMLLVQGGLIQGLADDVILKNISKGDIHSDYAQTYLDAVLTKPASQDIVAYQLRKDPSLATLETELKKIGIHPNYTELYKTLAYQIPPIADIITMAVREAFTPSIVAKFGQDEDFPADLEKYAGQKGLSKEWAKHYWAAHWALPSPLQGFEMLHRGVIDRSELSMLLRAQDVMPFWRDKLTAIAYRPLTRVDVRRMYKEGVLNEREVFESYQDQGYDDKNAERMAEFTVKQTLSSLSKFTSSDIIKAFSNRMINRSEGISMLRDIGVRSEDAGYIISTAEYKRLWAFIDDQIAGIRNLYKKRVYDKNQASDKLARLNLPAEQINVLMEQWYYDKVEELDATWTTAQTLRFLKRKLITPDRARRELYLNGYDTEHSDILLKDMQWTPPKD